jgi:flagellar biosynthesis protein
MASSNHKPTPQKRAVSLKYDGQGAPKVTAKGKGYLAEEIIALAKAHGIPITDNQELVALLSQVELDQEIPETLYAAVAQVLAFAYHLSQKTPPQKRD